MPPLPQGTVRSLQSHPVDTGRRPGTPISHRDGSSVGLQGSAGKQCSHRALEPHTLNLLVLRGRSRTSLGLKVTWGQVGTAGWSCLFQAS